MYITLSPDGKTAYVLNAHSNSVSILNVITAEVQKTVEVGSSPGSIAISTDGKRVFVTHNGEENLSVIETAGQPVVRQYRIPLM